MDFKSLVSKISSMDDPIELPKAPELPKAVQLNEDAQLRVLAGTSTILEEAKKMKDEKKEEKVKEGQEELKKVGDKVKTSKGVMTKTATGLKHERSYTKEKDEEDDEPKAKKAKKESIDPEAFKSKFSKMVEAKKAKKDYDGDGKVESGKDEYMGAKDKAIKKAMGKKVDEASKPDFLDLDKDGNKKEPMKKAAADKGGDKKDGKKGMSAKQEKYFGKKNESVKTSKKVVAESVETKLSFKDMVKLVQESGGQQQIDAIDTALFNWAQRVARNKLGEGIKADLYAGLIYERNGGTFEMYDVLAESKKEINESQLNEGMLGKLKDYVISKIMPKLSDEDKNNIQSAVQRALGKTEVSMADITPENIKAVGKALGAKPQAAGESMSMEGDDPFWHKSATTAEKITSMVGIVGGVASMIAAFTTGPAWLMIPGLIGLMFMSQVGTAKRGSGPVGSG